MADPRDRDERRPLGSAGVVLLTVCTLYLLLAVGPLAGLFFYAPLHAVFTHEALQEVNRSLWLTFRSSVIATGLAVLLGLPTAICLARLDFRGKHVVNALVELPIALPPLVLGVGLILMWGRRGILGHFLADAGHPLSFTPTAIVISQFVVASPFLVRIAKAAIEQVPRSLEQASLVLGVGPLATYARVTLPLAGKGLLSAALTCWARAMGEFGATILFAGNFPGRTQTLPIAIFMSMQFNIDQAIGMAIIMLAFSVFAFVVAQTSLSRATAVG
jgi:molybdate transport system permease protein